MGLRASDPAGHHGLGWMADGIEAWINPEELEPERLDAAAAQRQVAAGSPDLVDAI